MQMSYPSEHRRNRQGRRGTSAIRFITEAKFASKTIDGTMLADRNLQWMDSILGRHLQVDPARAAIAANQEPVADAEARLPAGGAIGHAVPRALRGHHRP